MTKRILIVCSGNAGRISPFIREQSDSLAAAGYDISYFLIRGRGLRGYLKNILPLRRSIQKYKPDIVHAHYGLSGLLAATQKLAPVVTTFHGSDINWTKTRPLSYLAFLLSDVSIFVSARIMRWKKRNRRSYLIPCGIDTELFVPMDRAIALEKAGLNEGSKRVLFSGSFNESVKNYPLAKDAVALLDGTELVELKGYSRQQVVYMLNSCDVLLMTSFNEGSPQIIKEAMACNTPIVSVDVGDVAERIAGIEGCYIAERTPESIAEALKKAIAFGKKTQARERILELDNKNIAKKIAEIYESL